MAESKTDLSPNQSRETRDQAAPQRTDAHEAIRFLAIKAAIFIGIPALASAIAVYYVLR